MINTEYMPTATNNVCRQYNEKLQESNYCSPHWPAYCWLSLLETNQGVSNQAYIITQGIHLLDFPSHAGLHHCLSQNQQSGGTCQHKYMNQLLWNFPSCCTWSSSPATSISWPTLPYLDTWGIIMKATLDVQFQVKAYLVSDSQVKSSTAISAIRSQVNCILIDCLGLTALETDVQSLYVMMEDLEKAHVIEWYWQYWHVQKLTSPYVCKRMQWGTWTRQSLLPAQEQVL